jgi:hypothetical protein
MVNSGIGSDYHLDLSKGFNAQAANASLHLPPDRTTVFTDSGRSAIRLTLRTLGLGPGNAVLVPSYICGSVSKPCAIKNSAVATARSVTLYCQSAITILRLKEGNALGIMVPVAV